MVVFGGDLEAEQVPGLHAIPAAGLATQLCTPPAAQQVAWGVAAAVAAEKARWA